MACDGDGRRVYKSSGKLYWYGAGSEILAETDGSGTVTTEYVYFGGRRIAMLPAGGSPQYYVEDFLGSSRVVTQSNGVVCYDADFTPFGGDISYTNSCPAQNNYKFEGKERDTETGNDDFGARYYTWRFGRWLSADWSSVPVAVPYANLSNPQTLNLYAMVADDPESFADLDGHCGEGGPEAGTAGGGSLDTRTTSSNGTNTPPTQGEPQQPPTTPTESAATKANSTAGDNELGATVTAVTGHTAPGTSTPYVESGVTFEVLITTTLPLASGPASVTAGLVDPRGNTHGEKLSVSAKPEDHVASHREGGAQLGPPGANLVRVSVTPVDGRNNFGVSGQTQMRFQITDSQGRSGTVKLDVFVRQPGPAGTSNGQRIEMLTRTPGRAAFRAP